MDLYATEAQTFRRITFPLVFPGILGAALLSFSLSFDDFIITNLNAGNTTTFPMYVWGVAQRGVPMQVNVVGTRDVHHLHRDRARGRAQPAAAGEGARLMSAADSLLGASSTPYWLDDPERPAALPGLADLPGPDTADLVVVGGGYLGLWTALLAKERDPEREVLLLEGADVRARRERAQRRLLRGEPDPRVRQRAWRAGPTRCPSCWRWVARTSTASSAPCTSTASTATSCAPGRSRWPPRSTRCSRCARSTTRCARRGWRRPGSPRRS